MHVIRGVVVDIQNWHNLGLLDNLGKLVKLISKTLPNH